MGTGDDVRGRASANGDVLNPPTPYNTAVFQGPTAIATVVDTLSEQGFKPIILGDFDDMPIERTLSMIKPSAVRDQHIGAILAKFEAAGLRIVAAKLMYLSKAQAEDFYGVHRERPFFGELVELMISGPVFVQVLEGENAVAQNREIMGATDPAEAAPGTIRAEFAKDISENAVHGSDATETAAVEIAFFFSADDIHSND